MLPVLHTFIHFRIVPFHFARSLSAPAVMVSRWSEKAHRATPTKKARRKRKQKEPDADVITIEEFAKAKIGEQWNYLARKACKASQQKAKMEANVRRRQLTLPKDLFLDLAFYAFHQKSTSATILSLFQAGVLTEPTDQEVHIYCSRQQLKQRSENPIRELIEGGKKCFEAAQKGYFSVSFKNEIIILLQWNPELTVSALIRKIMHLMCPWSHGKAMAMHRNTILKEGVLGDFGLRAGSTIAVIPL